MRRKEKPECRRLGKWVTSCLQPPFQGTQAPGNCLRNKVIHQGRKRGAGTGSAQGASRLPPTGRELWASLDLGAPCPSPSSQPHVSIFGQLGPPPVELWGGASQGFRNPHTGRHRLIPEPLPPPRWPPLPIPRPGGHPASLASVVGLASLTQTQTQRFLHFSRQHGRVTAERLPQGHKATVAQTPNWTELSVN